jgi:hypothetical protein
MRETRVSNGGKDLHCSKPLASFVTENGSGSLLQTSSIVCDRKWERFKTRPYMSVRMDLAQLLLSTGRTEETIRRFEALLVLNPNDNQGVRDVLLGCYLSCDNLTGAQRLLHNYPEDAKAIFAWGRTLERFLSGALRKARRENRFVEQYLMFQRPLPTDMPDTYGSGSDEAAIICLAYLSGAWADHPLATSWLREQLGFRQPSTPPQQKPPVFPKAGTHGRVTNISSSLLLNRFRSFTQNLEDSLPICMNSVEAAQLNRAKSTSCAVGKRAKCTTFLYSPRWAIAAA